MIGRQAHQGQPPSSQPRLPLHLSAVLRIAQGATYLARNGGKRCCFLCGACILSLTPDISCPTPSQSESSLAARLAAAEGELAYALEPNSADVVVVNDDLDRAYAVFKRIALGEAAVEGDKVPNDL